MLAKRQERIGRLSVCPCVWGGCIIRVISSALIDRLRSQNGLSVHVELECPRGGNARTIRQHVGSNLFLISILNLRLSVTDSDCSGRLHNRETRRAGRRQEARIAGIISRRSEEHTSELQSLR